MGLCTACLAPCTANLGLCTALLGLCTAFPDPQDCPKCPQECSKSLPTAPAPSILLDLTTLFTLFKTWPLVLSKRSWTAVWQLLGLSWTPFEHNFVPLGHLLGSSWGLLGSILSLQCLLGRPVGLLAWPPGPAWASGLPVWGFRMPVGRQLHASWTAKRLPESTYALRTSQQLSSPTELFASSAYVAV